MIYYILYCICRLLDFFKRGESLVPILMYHSISNSNSRLSINVDIFNKQMKYLFNRGYKTITPLNLKDKFLYKKILVTFDDGFSDNFINALPILQKYNFTATVFISTDYISKQSVFCSNDEDKNFLMLNEIEIKQLESNGWFIANHFASHKNLDTLDVGDLKQEFERSKNKLNTIIMSKESFRVVSYPHSKYNEKVLNLFKDLNIINAFNGGNKLFNTSVENCLLIPRIEINKNINHIKFKLLLSPSFYLIRDFFKKIF